MTQDITSACKLCGASEKEFLFSAVDLRFEIPGEFKIFRCNSCGLGFVHPQPLPGELKRHYPESYYTHALPEKTSKEKLEGILLNVLFRVFEGSRVNKKKNVFSRSFARLAKSIPRLRHRIETNAFEYLRISGGELLEIGFGNGVFLNFALKRGYSTYGVDPDPINCDNQKNQGHNIFCGELKVAKYSDNKFDFIRMRHVLEHVTDPADEMREIFRIQKHGGYFFLEVPNFGGLYAEIFKDTWAQLEAPRHLFHFNQENLKRFVRQSGYEVIRVTVDTQPWHLLSSMKYTMDKMNGAISESKKGSDIRLDTRVSSSLHTLSRWLASHGYGDNIIMLARKPPL